MNDPLEVRRDGSVVARLHRRRGGIACEYSEEILDTVPLGRPVLSCSLPVTPRPADATAWVRGLLPEGQHLNALAATLDVAASDTFALVARYGRDVAGAFEIVAADPVPRIPSIEPYAADALAEAVAALDTYPLAIQADSELSLAGLQNKLVAVWTPDGWARPIHGFPSTHIIKVDDGRHPGLIAAEAACLSLAREVGLTSVDARCERFGTRDVLIVSRFDRENIDGTTRRLHQEDLLQALGMDPFAHRGRAKYQTFGTPGPPSWWHAADLLDTYAEDPSSALLDLVRAVTFTTAISNADCHAKNVALLLEGGHLTLAPLYDTVPTALWPTLRPSVAMTVNDVGTLADITMDDIVAEARRWLVPASQTQATATDLLDSLAAAVRSCEHPQVAELVASNVERLRR